MLSTWALHLKQKHYKIENMTNTWDIIKLHTQTIKTVLDDSTAIVSNGCYDEVVHVSTRPNSFHITSLALFDSYKM